MLDSIKKISLKNRPNYFFNDIINIKKIVSDLLKIDKKLYKSIDIYYIGYITIKNIDDYESIHSVNTLYIIIGEKDRYIDKKMEKTLNFCSYR